MQSDLGITRSSAVGSAPRSGRGGRAFESPLLDQTKKETPCEVSLFEEVRISCAEMRLFEELQEAVIFLGLLFGALVPNILANRLIFSLLLECSEIGLHL